jgi:O-antigen ligase
MRRREWASASLGAAAVAISIFAVGGGPRWAQALVAIATACAVATLLPSRRVPARRSPLVILIGIALALTVLQLLPLPGAIVHWLDATGADLRDDGAALVGLSPGSTLSLDVAGTLAGVGYFLVLLGVAAVASRFSTSETGRFRIIALVAALCGIAAIVTAIDELVDANGLYGVYQPLQIGPRTIAPLLNNNHFGCLMAVGAVLSLGLALYRRQPSWARALWLANLVACALEMLNTLSRGAAVALALGAFVTVATVVAQRFIAHETPRRRRASFLTTQLPIGVVAACTVVVVLYVGSSGVAQQFENTSFSELHAQRSKFAAWRSAGALIDESPWVGVGRGAMESAFTRVHPASAYASYSHLENEYLQAVVDWGAPAAIVLGCATIWLVVAAMKRWRDGPLAAGGLGALAVVMLQSNVDFGVELLGIAVPITAVAATLVYVPLREAEPRAVAASRGLRGVHVAALAVAALLLLSNKTSSVEEDHLAIAGRSDIAFSDLAGPFERHPLDYYNYQVAAQLMIRAHDPNAIRLLNHALVLNPAAPSLHLMAARLLYDARHLEQSAVEYAAALPPIRDKHRLLLEITSRFPPQIAATAIPVDLQALREIITILDEAGRSDVAVAWLARVLERQPHALPACDLLYEEARKGGDASVVGLAVQRCGTYQPSREVRIALANALLSKHGEAEAVHLLSDVENWRGLNDEKIQAWLVLCDAHIGLDHWDEAQRCLHRLDASRLVPIERAAEIAKRLEHIHDARASATTGSGSASP